MPLTCVSVQRNQTAARSWAGECDICHKRANLLSHRHMRVCPRRSSWLQTSPQLTAAPRLPPRYASDLGPWMSSSICSAVHLRRRADTRRSTRLSGRRNSTSISCQQSASTASSSEHGEPWDRRSHSCDIDSKRVSIAGGNHGLCRGKSRPFHLQQEPLQGSFTQGGCVSCAYLQAGSRRNLPSIWRNGWLTSMG